MLGDWKPKEIEPKWQKAWEDSGANAFDASSTKPVFSIDTPPPFTSGDLHMGHVLSYSYIDFAARYKRMRGFNVFYPQGWDCQGFPTEVKVEAKFGKGLPRSEFRAKCVEWTEEFAARMRAQMVSMGFSPDWRHEYKTMSPAYHKSVQRSLLQMYADGTVYRAEHPVFWCPNCGSAIAKAECEEENRQTDLNFLKFAVDPSVSPEGFITIATTRPELLHACVAVFVNPGDERYRGLIGKTTRVPLYGKDVKILSDPDVDAAFGTGIVMMCTFGDKQDVVWTYRHNLPLIRSMDARGRLLNAGEFAGLKTAEAKTKIIEKLKTEGLLVKQEKLAQTVKIHDRCKKPIELITSKQWFCKVKGFEEQIKNSARGMKWIPEFTLQYLLDWANFIEWDWVISRDRIFGTPLPFWYCEKCDFIVTPEPEQLPVNPETGAAPADKCPKCGGGLKPELATCDCWVDSSISPLVISKWGEDEAFHKLTFPATLRPQGTEIIRTWAFYTIYRCQQLTGKAPFRELLINGMVLAPDGKKMSKSLGNVIPPDKLIDEYSADAVRQWTALSGAFARDKPLSYKDTQYAKSFIIKLWNASKLVEKSVEGFDPKKDASPSSLRAVDKWMLSRLNRLVKSTTENYDNYDYFAVITSIHEFFWHEFCDFYLEEVKHRLYQSEKFGEESKKAAQYTMYSVLLGTLKMLSPISPHTTEEIYTSIFKSREGDSSLAQSAWPEFDSSRVDEKAEQAGKLLNAVLTEVRRFKADQKLALNAEIASVSITAPVPELVELIREEIEQAGKAKTVASAKGEFKVNVEK